MVNSNRGKVGNGGPSPAAPASAPPEQVANTPPPALVKMDSILLQSMMEVQKAVAELGTKTERLVSDVSKQNEKIDNIKDQINFVRGASWVILGLLGLIFAGALAFGVAIFNKAAGPGAAQGYTAPTGQPPTTAAPVR